MIDALADEISRMLADPHRHTELSGSGMLRGPSTDTPPISGIGHPFAMRMHDVLLDDCRTIKSVTPSVPGPRTGRGPTPDAAVR